MKECLLWQKARDIAAERGLEMSPRCPLQDVCSGESCIMMEPATGAQDQINKFYSKLEKHFDGATK